MSWWGWLLVGLGCGMAIVGIPVMVWIYKFIRDWDRAWG